MKAKKQSSLLVGETTFNRLLNGILMNTELVNAIKIFINSHNCFNFEEEDNKNLVEYFLRMWFNPKLDPETKRLMVDFNKSQMKHFKKL